MDRLGVPALPALILGVATGIGCGALNGFLIHRAGGVGAAFFLTTLATSSIFQGINLMITEGKPFYGIDANFFLIGDTMLLGIPTAFIIMIVVAIILSVMFEKMKIGRQILAYGANSKAAEIYGVSKFKVVFFSSIIAGAIAALAGLLGMIRIRAAQPNMGSDWMLMSFAAPLIGGTVLTGGKVNVFGTVIGALALTIISNGLVHLAVDVYWNTLIYGCVIMLAVSLDQLRHFTKRW